MADLEANFLTFANSDSASGVGDGEKKEENTFFKNAGKMREVFEIEQKAASKGKKGKEPLPQLSKAEEEERVMLIRQYNEYMRDAVISYRLAKAGYRGPGLNEKKALDYSNVSLAQIRTMMNDINDCLSGDESKMLAFQALSTMNGIAMRYQPILAESPSLQDVFIQQLQDRDSNMALSMSELSIRLQPYTPTGFFARFVSAYGMMIKQTVDHRKGEKEKDIETKFTKEDVCEMENKYSGL